MPELRKPQDVLSVTRMLDHLEGMLLSITSLAEGGPTVAPPREPDDYDYAHALDVAIAKANAALNRVRIIKILLEKKLQT